MNQKLTPLQEAEIRDLYLCGASVTEISRRFGISRQHVYRVGNKELAPIASKTIALEAVKTLVDWNTGRESKNGKKITNAIKELEDFFHE